MISERDYEVLSAYVDGQLGERDRTALEARLSDDRALRLALKDLRQDKLLLRKLPTARAPRAFTLTRAQAASIRAPRRRNGFFSTFNVMRLATGLASLLFATLLGLDLARTGALVAREEAPGVVTAGEVAAPQADGVAEIAGSTANELTEAPEFAALAGPPEATLVEGAGGGGADSTATEDLSGAALTGPSELEGAQSGGDPEATPDLATGKVAGEQATPVAETEDLLRISQETDATPESTTLAFQAPLEPGAAPLAESDDAGARELQPEPAIQLWTMAAGALALALAALTAAVWLMRRGAR